MWYQDKMSGLLWEFSGKYVIKLPWTEAWDVAPGNTCSWQIKPTNYFMDFTKIQSLKPFIGQFVNKF